MQKRFTYRQIRHLVLYLSVAVLFFAAGYQVALVKGGTADPLVQKFVGAPGSEQVAGADFGKYWEVWKRLEKSYVDPTKLDYREMTWGSMRGLASSLDDPYTQYLPPEENKAANEDLNGSFSGVGIELGYIESTLAVVAPLKGTPAELAGVRAGDLILNIRDDKKGLDIDTRGMTLPEAVKNIRGERGVPVVLTLYRDGVVEPFEVEIVRSEIVVPSVELTFVEQEGRKYAHLALARFGGRTDREWLTAVREIMDNAPDGIVLDLRNNPGGYLDGAVFVAGEFLSSGLVVKQEGRSSSENYEVDRRGNLISTPLVVLINKGSASASEIVAGALQDHGRAKVVGEQSFGKGTVQEVQDLSDGSSLHVTVAKWILPSGRWIGEEGIAPDIEAKDEAETEEVDEALEMAIGELR